MSTQADSLYESPLAAERSTVTAIPRLQQLAWSVRRELWENRSSANVLARRLSGGMEAIPSASGGLSTIHPGTQITIARYLGTPGLWTGFAVTALFLAGAVQLRRYRGAL